MKKVRFFKYLLILSFTIGISAPLVIMYFSDEKTVSTTEKRSLAEKPSLTFKKGEIVNYPKKFEEYFNDHFGLRDHLVKLYNSFFVSLFNVSTRPNEVIVGKDDWLFLSTPEVLGDFSGQKRLSNYDLRSWKKVLLDREEWLQDLGIEYLFVKTPNKMSIYPEFLPFRYQKLQGINRAEQFVDYLALSEEQPNFLSLQSHIEESKHTEQLYFKNDTHWTMDGSYIGYSVIMNHLNKTIPGMDPLPKEELVRKEVNVACDLGFMLNLPHKFREDTSYLHLPGYEEAVEFQDTNEFDGLVRSDHEVYRDFRVEMNINPDKTGTAILIADSFGAALQDYLTYHFGKLLVIEGGRFEDAVHVIDKAKPDVVIDLIVERGLELAMVDSLFVQEHLSKKNENVGQTVVHLDMWSTAYLNQLAFKKDVEIVENKSGAELIVGGVDGQFVFNLSSDVSSGTLNIKCKITSPVATNFRVFFLKPGDKTYTAESSVSQKLRKGENSFNLWIQDQIQLDSVRVDPGEVTGSFQLKDLSIIEIGG